MKNSNYYDHLFANFTNDIPLVYDFKNNRLFISEVIAKKYGLEMVYHDMPYTFANDFVNPEYRKQYCDDFNRFKTTKKATSITYYGNSCANVLRCDHFEVMDSNVGLAIGYSKDITNEHMQKESKNFNEVIQNIQRIFFKPDASRNSGQEALLYLCQYFKSDQAFIALFNEQKKLEIKYNYSSDIQNAIFNNRLYFKILENEYLNCDFHPHIINEMKIFPNVKNFIELPLINNQGAVMGVAGFVNADALKTNFVFLDSLVNSLSLGIQNILYHEDLYYAAYYDRLTGVKNRNAYEQFVQCFKSRNLQNFGLLIVDVNGLKTCNDSQGHEAGDVLICKVANALKKYFAAKDIFRFGGDEFLVVTYLTEDEIIDKISAFKMEINGDAAVGYAYSEGNIDFAMMKEEADQYMYQDKEEFYKNNPTLNRRLR